MDLCFFFFNYNFLKFKIYVNVIMKQLGTYAYKNKKLKHNFIIIIVIFFNCCLILLNIDKVIFLAQCFENMIHN